MAVSKQQLTQVFQSIVAGMGIKKSLELHKVEMHAFYDAVNSDPILTREYARAQQTRAELLVDEIIDIADTEADAQVARNRVDARKWYASKMQPQKYGERLDVNLNTTVDISLALAEGAARAALPQRYPEIAVESEVIESKPILPTPATGHESVGQDADIFS